MPIVIDQIVEFGQLSFNRIVWKLLVFRVVFVYRLEPLC